MFAHWSVMRERSIGSLISHVFEGRTSTGSGPFSVLILYALTLPNLYCYVSLLLKRRFAQEFVETHGLTTSRLRASLKKKNNKLPIVARNGDPWMSSLKYTFRWPRISLFIYLFNPRYPDIKIQFLICYPYRFPMKVVGTSC